MCKKTQLERSPQDVYTRPRKYNDCRLWCVMKHLLIIHLYLSAYMVRINADSDYLNSLLSINKWYSAYTRVSKVMADHDDLLTHWRYFLIYNTKHIIVEYFRPHRPYQELTQNLHTIDYLFKALSLSRKKGKSRPQQNFCGLSLFCTQPPPPYPRPQKPPCWC